MTNVTLRQTAIRAIQHNVSLDQHWGQKQISQHRHCITGSQPAHPCVCVSECVVGTAAGPGHWIPISTFNLINQDIDSVLDGELHNSKGLITLLLPRAIHNRQTRHIPVVNLVALLMPIIITLLTFLSTFIVCLQPALRSVTITLCEMNGLNGKCGGRFCSNSSINSIHKAEKKTSCLDENAQNCSIYLQSDDATCLTASTDHTDQWRQGSEVQILVRLVSVG